MIGQMSRAAAFVLFAAPPFVIKAWLRPWAARTGAALPVATGWLPSFGYAGGMVLAIALVTHGLGWDRQRRWVALVCVSLGAVCYELLQATGLFPKRQFDFADLAATVLGALAGMAVEWVIDRPGRASPTSPTAPATSATSTEPAATGG